jgi:hypothetical protein
MQKARKHSILQAFNLFCIDLQRRGRDSNPRYKFKLVQRFSKPALSATQAPLRITPSCISGEAKITINSAKMNTGGQK